MTTLRQEKGSCGRLIELAIEYMQVSNTAV